MAVLLVIIHHWLPNYDMLPLGAWGVTFFFTLSGYLISGNLFYLKQSIDNREISMPQAFKLFYLRRTLRIFPLYYLTILLVYLLAKPVFEGKLIWYITYLPNILMFQAKSWPGMLSPFWSLGVEEQFYLLWPLLIFLVRWDRMRYLFTFMISVSILLKGVSWATHGSFFVTVLPWNNFDSFGAGAILAYIPFSRQKTSVLDRIPFWGGVLISLVTSFLTYRKGIFFVFGITVSAASFLIIRQAQKGFTGLSGKFLDNAMIRYFGRISYGLYIYHSFIPWLWRCLTGKETAYPLPIALFADHSWLNRPIVALSAEFILLIGIATLSWFLVEKPFINLKGFIKLKKGPTLAA